MKKYKLKLSEKYSTKFIVFCVAILSFMMITNCEKSDLLSADKDKTDKENVEMFDEYGQQHNKLLTLYFSSDGEMSDSFDERLAAIDGYYSEIDANYKPGFLKGALEESIMADENLRYIGSNEFSHQGAQRIVNLAAERGQITKDVHAYMNQALNIYSGELGLQDMVNSVKKMTDQIVDDKALTIEDRDDLLKIMSIANYSLAFLQEQYGDNPDIDSPEALGIPPWAERDLTGAFTAVASGSVGYGVAVGGPWGGAAVMIGFGAVSSAFR